MRSWSRGEKSGTPANGIRFTNRSSSFYRKKLDIPVGFTPHVFAFRSTVKDFQVQPTGPFYMYGLGGLGMTWLER
jgi:hypothetical protein